MVSLNTVESVDISPGMHDARFVGFVEIGAHSTTFNNETKPAKHRCKLLFEVFEEDEQGNVVSKIMAKNKVTLSIGKRANLTKIIGALLGTTDLKTISSVMTNDGIRGLFNKPVSVEVETGEINGEMRKWLSNSFTQAHPKLRDTIPQATGEPIFFFLDDDDTEGAVAAFKQLTAFTRKEVMSAENVDSYPPHILKAAKDMAEDEVDLKARDTSALS